MENKIMYKFGFIINYKLGRKHKIHKEIQTITSKYGLIKGNHLTVACFNHLQEAIAAKNLLMDITETSETVYAIQIKDKKVIEFQEIKPQKEVNE
jgi:hypothetical protein